jgi:hypothetical protein
MIRIESHSKLIQLCEAISNSCLGSQILSYLTKTVRLEASPRIDKHRVRVSGLPDRFEPIPGLSQKEQGHEAVRPRDQSKFLCTETKVHQTKYIV